MMEGVRRGYTLLVLYVMKTIERLGTEPALGILEEAAEEQGALIAEEMRGTMPEGLTPLETGAEVYRRFMSDAGAEVSVHEIDDASVTFLVRRCPFYEAFLDVGVDCGYFLNGLCSNLTLPSIQATLRQFDPRLRVESVLTRRAAEEFCLERVVLSEA
jgi:predicted ArsR family transcriptional regulator